MMETSLHPEVTAEIARHFSHPDAANAEALLRATPLPLLPDLTSVDSARVHMAAIKLADGDLGRLRSALAVAATDWRDVLVAAGLAHGDWQEVLKRAGFGVPGPL